MTTAAAGWYADPSDNRIVRFWDGSQYTDERTLDVETVDPATPPRSNSKSWRIAGTIGGVVLLVAIVAAAAGNGGGSRSGLAIGGGGSESTAGSSSFCRDYSATWDTVSQGTTAVGDMQAFPDDSTAASDHASVVAAATAATKLANEAPSGHEINPLTGDRDGPDIRSDLDTLATGLQDAAKGKHQDANIDYGVFPIQLDLAVTYGGIYDAPCQSNEVTP